MKISSFGLIGTVLFMELSTILINHQLSIATVQRKSVMVASNLADANTTKIDAPKTFFTWN